MGKVLEARVRSRELLTFQMKSNQLERRDQSKDACINWWVNLLRVFIDEWVGRPLSPSMKKEYDYCRGNTDAKYASRNNEDNVFC